MLSKEEFEREIIRMWDSVRTESKGKLSCDRVSCVDCPIQYINNQLCQGYIDNKGRTNFPIECAIDIIELVEKWSKEHPIATNRDKLKEVFGEQLAHDIITEVTNNCVGHKCPYVFKNDKCEDCFYDGFWKKEYQEPKESEI